jgi:protein-S-isoprenylcysteine O-methyltransferase Ste14
MIFAHEMSSHETKEIIRETKYSHFIQTTLPIAFISIYLLDTFIFQFSVGLNDIIPFIIRIILFVITLGIALILIKMAHDALFKHNTPSNTLLTSGILSHVRNPMYLGVLLIYVAFILLSISLISLGFFIIVALIYNKMVNYEEKVLEELFGDQWLEYKKRVPKWIPR